jgi:hypothetical protein
VVFGITKFENPPLSVAKLCPNRSEWVYYWAGGQIKEPIREAVEFLGTLSNHHQALRG